MYDEVLISVDSATAKAVPRHTMNDLGLQERAHLQEWVLAHPEIIGPGVDVVTSEFDRWQDATGGPVGDRLDILAVGSDGRLIVVELKREPAPHTVHMQAINYAAMVSRLSMHDIADLYVAHRQRVGVDVDQEAALARLESELLLTVDGIRKPRIVIIAADFPSSVTAAVVWLNEQQVDISLTRFRVYQVAGQTVVSFNQLFPVPDVEEFTIGRRQTADGAPARATPPEPGEPWTLEALATLATIGNPATLAVLDLCAAANGEPVTVADVATAAGIGAASVRGQLAGLTMQLRNPKSRLGRRDWPFKVAWGRGGFANYSTSDEIANWWRGLRPEAIDQAAGAPSEAAQTHGAAEDHSDDANAGAPNP